MNARACIRCIGGVLNYAVGKTHMITLDKWCKRVIISGESNKHIPDVETFDDERAERNRGLNKTFRELNKCRTGSVVVVGSGPSARLPSLPAGEVMALGKVAAKRLLDNGITPDWLVIADPDVKVLPKAKDYLAASQCDPLIFKRYNPIAFLMRPYPATLGVASMAIAHCLGYTDIHWVGIDSSGIGHIGVICEGREFKTNHRLLYQKNQFLSLIGFLIDQGVGVHVHGDGYLPWLLKCMYTDSKGPIHKWIYNTDIFASTYDALNVLVNARMIMNRAGYSGPGLMRFDGNQGNKTSAVPAEKRQELLDNVIRPLLPFFNIVEDRTIETDRVYPTCYIPITEAVRKGEDVPRLKIGGVIRHPRRLSITLRECPYMEFRNSNIEAWMSFARRRQGEGYQVVFCRDTAKADLPLRDAQGEFETAPAASKDIIERIKLYESCGCNLGYTNGPMSLLWFSDNPFLTFTPLHLEGYDPSMPGWWRSSAGIDPDKGETFPWFRDNQKLEWCHDTESNIENAWVAWQARNSLDELLAA